MLSIISFFKKPYIYILLLAVCACFLVIISQTGCISPPSRDDYKFESCFSFQACLYRAKKKKDTVVCKGDSDDCSKDREMGRKERVVKRCMNQKNRPKSWNFEHCKDFYLSGSSK